MRAQGCLNRGAQRKQLENTASVWFATRTPSEFSIAFAISPRVEATLGSHWSMPLASFQTASLPSPRGAFVGAGAVAVVFFVGCDAFREGVPVDAEHHCCL